MKRLRIYTDGSCPRNPGPGGWAYVILRDGDDHLYESGYAREATNNTMELWAALAALRRVRREYMRHVPTIVTTDSQYLVQGMQNWRHIWEFKNFDVKNGDIWRRLHYYAERMRQVRFVWVKGHRGDYWNEWCDRMAGDAVKSGNAQFERQQWSEENDKLYRTVRRRPRS